MKKQILAYFQYLVCSNRVFTVSKFTYTWSGGKSRGKLSKFITNDYIFPNKNVNRFFLTPSFFPPVTWHWHYFCWHIYFWWSRHFCDIKMTCDFVTWFSLCCNAIIGPSCQHFGNAVNMKVGNYIAMINSFYYLNYLCKVDLCCIFMISFKVLYERSCQLLFL